MGTFAVGVCWSLAAAVAHTAIDSLRKIGSTSMPPTQLVALVAVFDAVIAAVGVASTGALAAGGVLPPHPLHFLCVTLTSSYLLLFSKWLYQKALHASPLSLTVPYLAFTPAILVVVAFFVIGETPTLPGIAGVSIVTLGGYLLGKRGAPAAAELDNDAGAAAGEQQPGCLSKDGGQKSGSMAGPPQPQQQPGSPSKAKAASSPPPSAMKRVASGLLGGAAATSAAAAALDGEGGTSGRSVWALAFYKNKRASVFGAGQQSSGGDVELGVNGNGDESKRGGSGGGGAPGSPHAGSPRATTTRLLQQHNGDGGSNSASSLPPPSARLRAVGRRLARTLAAPSPRSGPVIVLLVAFVWSITASLDKVGINAAPSLAAYFLAQRVAIGAGCAGWLAFSKSSGGARAALRTARARAPLLVAISLLEQGAVLFFLAAIQNILVSYVVAIKRVNVLFSTLAGAALFGESVARRLPFILLMLAGMLVIVLQPGHELLHHHSAHP